MEKLRASGKGKIMKIISVVGKSGSGKTTLITKLVKYLKRKKCKVAVIKHCHQGFDIKGKDSWRMINAGADMVSVVSEERYGIFYNTKIRSINEIVNHFKGIDIVIIEGFKKKKDIPSIFISDKGIKAINGSISFNISKNYGLNDILNLLFKLGIKIACIRQRS